MYDPHNYERRDTVSENEALRRRVEARMDLNERLLWAGRPLRAGWFRGVLPLFFFGLAWSALVAFGVWQAVVPLWSGKGAGAEAGGLGRWGETLFFVPFVVAGIGLVLSPLWAWLAARARAYAVTDRRAMVLVLRADDGVGRPPTWVADRAQRGVRAAFGRRLDGARRGFPQSASGGRGRGGTGASDPARIRSLA